MTGILSDGVQEMPVVVPRNIWRNGGKRRKFTRPIAYLGFTDFDDGYFAAAPLVSAFAVGLDL